MPMAMALPAGRLFAETAFLLARCGLDAAAWRADERQLTWSSPDGEWRFLLARPADVVTYVREGAASVGVAGKDCLLEAEASAGEVLAGGLRGFGAGVSELLDLRLGGCRLVLAAPRGTELPGFGEKPCPPAPGQAILRVATRYPGLTRRFLEARGVPSEVIPLRGATELAAVVGLADAVVDAVDTGRTLHENRLEVVAEISPSSARLIANPAAFQLRHDRVADLVARLRRELNGRLSQGPGPGRRPPAPDGAAGPERRTS